MLRVLFALGVLAGTVSAEACDHAQVQVTVPTAVVSPFAIVPQVLTAPIVVSAGSFPAAVTVVAAAPVVVERQRPVVVRSRTVIVRRGLLSRVFGR